MVVHVIAVFVMTAWHGEKLVRAMITGCKRRLYLDMRTGHCFGTPTASITVR